MMTSAVHPPPKSLIGSAVGYCSAVIVRQGLKPAALGDGEFADYVESVRQSDGILLALDGDKSVSYLIDIFIRVIGRVEDRLCHAGSCVVIVAWVLVDEVRCAVLVALCFEGVALSVL